MSHCKLCQSWAQTTSGPPWTLQLPRHTRSECHALQPANKIGSSEPPYTKHSEETDLDGSSLKRNFMVCYLTLPRNRRRMRGFKQRDQSYLAKSGCKQIKDSKLVTGAESADVGKLETDSANSTRAPRSWRRGSATTCRRQGKSEPVGTCQAARTRAVAPPSSPSSFRLELELGTMIPCSGSCFPTISRTPLPRHFSVPPVPTPSQAS